MKESQLQRKILDILNATKGCKAVPTTQGFFGRKGEPDIYGCYKRRCFVIEVKLPGQELREIQAKRLREWASSGAKAVCVDSIDALYKFIKEMES